MHLVYENLIKNLISFWCSDFKDLDHKGEGYCIRKTVWDGIGEATAAAGRTTPLAYGPAVPNFTEDGVRMTADMYSFWFQYLGPVLLKHSFKKQETYDHFVVLVKLINLCLKFSITHDEVQEIQDGFIWWVEEYERIYYQDKADRLSACPVTVHALLHIAEGIIMLGPVWVYWAFAMERFCGRIGRVIRSRRFPFSNLDNQILAHAQLTQLKNTYPKLRQELSLIQRPVPLTIRMFLSQPADEKYALVAPRQIDPHISPALFTKLAAALVTRFSPLDAEPEDLIPIQRAKELLNASTIESWGRLRRLECGDTMLASELVRRESEDRRDATFVRYDNLVDKNARKARGKPELVSKTSYGQLNYVFLIKLPPAIDLGIMDATYIALAAISECDKPVQHSSGLDIHVYTKLRASEVVDIATVQALVGRVWWRNKWSIFDRSGDLARAVFDEGDDSDVGD
ncbi:hypothetical protein DFP72DRAFT_807899 [Ephemerocybe angulata]|uniref:Uncharacterized protein n=1 Tax=Ephemerocybe angulata TaxID=980116 RepID=A0A8H6I3Z3_9AGAR|nr:hypothetical protein DFP72DRAFT_807899 [Tulosesus angulatus]